MVGRRRNFFPVQSSAVGTWGQSPLPPILVGIEALVLHMCFERFLLAFESRDLSQADKRITRVSSFPSLNFWMVNYSYTQKSYLALWQNRFGQFITQKFPSLKSKQFSQVFFWWEVNLRGLTKFSFQKVQAWGLRDRKITFTTHHSVWERKHSFNTFVSLR